MLGVVDPKTLKVYGTSNLRVVDASVIPMILAAHPVSTIYAIAERVSNAAPRTLALTDVPAVGRRHDQRACLVDIRQSGANVHRAPCSSIASYIDTVTYKGRDTYKANDRCSLGRDSNRRRAGVCIRLGS